MVVKEVYYECAFSVRCVGTWCKNEVCWYGGWRGAFNPLTTSGGGGYI